ncbi:hypothetical protein [Bacteroides sp.]
MKKYLFFILMAISLIMYSCENEDDSSTNSNIIDTEFITDRSLDIKAFSSDKIRVYSTSHKETGCSECNADGTEFDAILFDKNSSNKTYRYVLNIKVSPQKDIKKGDKLTMVGGFFAGSKDDFLKYEPKNISGEIVVEEVYKEKGIILSFKNLSWKNTPDGGTIYNLTGKLAFTYPNYNPLANK